MTDEPLAGRTVLLARAPERARGLAGRLGRLGAEVLVAPVTATAPAPDPAALDDAVRRLAAGAYAWAAPTSVNGVEALAAAAARTGVALAAAPARWAAVGPATARALAAAGVRADLVPDADSSAAGLVAAFGAPDAGADRAVLLPLGDLAGPTLADGLAALGWVPDRVVAYRTVPAALPDDVVRRAAAIDAVVATSGSVVRELARQLPAPPALVAVGRPTADAARAAGLPVAAVADRPTDEALAAAVLTALTRPLVPEENRP